MVLWWVKSGVDHDLTIQLVALAGGVHFSKQKQFHEGSGQIDAAGDICIVNNSFIYRMDTPSSTPELLRYNIERPLNAPPDPFPQP